MSLLRHSRRRTMEIALAIGLGLLTGPLVARGATDTVPLHGSPALPANSRLVIWGDSITEMTHYPRFVETYLLVCQGRTDMRFWMAGHSGERLGSLISRGSDLDAIKPTAITFCEGMNDTEYSPWTEQKGTGFDQTMKAVLASLKARGLQQIVVVGPGAVDDTYGADGKPDTAGTSTSHVLNGVLDRFHHIAHDDATAVGAAYADVHDRMIEAYAAADAKLGPGYNFAQGGGSVHPAVNGHLVMAFEILKALGCDGNLASIDVDYAGSAKVSDGQHLVSYSNGVLVLQSDRYPFCVDQNPAQKDSPQSPGSILPFLPFQQELNRFVLKVSNLVADSADVTWGTATRHFSAEQLAKGINLPEEFAQTPFDEAFSHVFAAVTAQHDWDNFMIKGTSNYFGNDNGGNIDSNMLAVDDQIDAALKKAIVPVTNTIVIVPAGKTLRIRRLRECRRCMEPWGRRSPMRSTSSARRAVLVRPACRPG